MTKGKETKKKRKPRFVITKEIKEEFLANLQRGVNTTTAIKAAGWSTSNYYLRIKSDPKLKREVDAAKAKYELTVHEAKVSLIAKQNVKIVMAELDRMERRDTAKSWITALQKAQQKAISEGNFKLAKQIQEQIDEL